MNHIKETDSDQKNKISGNIYKNKYMYSIILGLVILLSETEFNYLLIGFLVSLYGILGFVMQDFFKRWNQRPYKGDDS